MNRIVDRYLTKQLLFASFIATLVFSGPVILVSLFNQLPNGYVFSRFTWPALATITPLVLYQAMPVFVAGAIVWCYGRFSSEGILLTLHLAGQSILRVRAPALYVAAAATLLGYAMSCVIAPLTAGHMHDVLRFVRHDIDPIMLTPGSPNELQNGRLTIMFKKFLSKNELADVFIRIIKTDGKEQAYVAPRAMFKRDGKDSSIVLFNGSLQEFNPKKGIIKNANFNQLTAPLTNFGITYLKHSFVFEDELSTPELLRKRAELLGNSMKTRNWTREVVKRFSIPILAIIHTLLGLELLALLGIMTDRRTQPVAAICGALAAIHFAIVLATEQIGLDLIWAWATAAMIGLELAVAIGLMVPHPEWVTGPLKSFATQALNRIRSAPPISAPAHVRALPAWMYLNSPPMSPAASSQYPENVGISTDAAQPALAKISG